MDYEKKYKEALNRARQFSEHPLQEDSSGIVEYIFPELRESEDEKIRMSIVDIIKSQKEQQCHIDGAIYDKMIAWLERQGEFSDQIHYWTEEEIEPIISDYFRGAEHYGGMIARLRCLKPKSLEKQGEQKPQRIISAEAKEALYNKPKWSEEDENIKEDIILNLQENYRNKYINERTCLDEIHWLKSIKERIGE